MTKVIRIALWQTHLCTSVPMLGEPLLQARSPIDMPTWDTTAENVTKLGVSGGTIEHSRQDKIVLYETATEVEESTPTSQVLSRFKLS